MKKLMVVLLFVLALFLSGCEALRMTPDGWLDPQRWEQEELAKTKLKYSRAADAGELQTQF